MYTLVFSNSYQKRARKFFSSHFELLSQYEKVLELLCLNPRHPSLRLHKLSGRLSDLHSVSINLSYRLIIHLIIQDKQIILVDIGTHDHVY